MLKILRKSYSFILKLVKLFGYNMIIRKNKTISNVNALQQINLNQKNIENLKVILNREILLKFLPKNGITAEIGVDKGDFSKKIISLTHPKKLFLIDTWGSGIIKMNFVKNRFQNEINSGTVVIKRGFSEIELEKVENGYFDWVYIDTTHSYNQTLKELELCRLKVKDNGIIAGHDYCQGNINRALPYGVVQAVNQFCMKNNWEFIFLTHETDRKLSFAIRRIK